MTKLSEIKEKWLKDQTIKKHYEDLSNEFEIASQLIKARIKAGMTQSEVAKRMQTTQSVVARLESGSYLPSVNTLLRYANVVGCKAKIVIKQKNSEEKHKAIATSRLYSQKLRGTKKSHCN